MYFEFLKFIFYVFLIIVISKYFLVEILRKLSVSLNLKSRTTGEITGASTSVPEFLTITISSLKGLAGAGLYNILSSNIINFVQYVMTIVFNKNIKKLNNIAVKVNMVLVIFTIIIPLVLMKIDIQTDLFFVAIFILLYVFFAFISRLTHKKYFGNYDDNLNSVSQGKNIRKSIRYIGILFMIGIILFVISVLLGECLEKLCLVFNIPQIVVGIILGLATSLPELITFFESQKFHKNENDDMVGVIEATNNLLTSNTLNLFIIQAIGVFIMTFVV